ncbi:hypothetical protein FQZ97_1125230 [compost metagenome]
MAITIKTCSCCGKPILARRNTKIYCSTYCQVKMFRHEQRKRKLAEDAAIIAEFENQQTQQQEPKQ